MKPTRVHWRKVALFNVFAFGISWTVALATYMWGLSIASVAGIIG